VIWKKDAKVLLLAKQLHREKASSQMIDLDNVKACIQSLLSISGATGTAPKHFDWEWARMVQAGETAKAEELAVWYRQTVR
jgi:hypothetical protein